MVLKVNTKTMKNWIAEYYEKYYGVKGKADVTAAINYKGIFEGTSVTIKLVFAMPIEGETVESEKIISKDELTEICKSKLEESNLILESLDYQIEDRYSGYGFDENLRKVFEGLHITVKEPALKRLRENKNEGDYRRL